LRYAYKGLRQQHSRQLVKPYYGLRNEYSPALETAKTKPPLFLKKRCHAGTKNSHRNYCLINLEYKIINHSANSYNYIEKHTPCWGQSLYVYLKNDDFGKYK
jgi:hypothetical protein